MATTVLKVRVSLEECALLEAASDEARCSLSEFVRRKAIDAAESETVARRIVTIPAEHGAAFEAWMQQPAKESPGLRELVGRRLTWRR